MQQRRPGGLEFASRQRCSQIPYSGVVVSSYDPSSCWIGGWRLKDGELRYILYVFGYEPGSDQTKQAMLAGIANSRVRDVPLANGYGGATMKHFGRTCVVVSYRNSSEQSYYELLAHRFVKYCNWREIRQ
jgi:hypothetical protein